MPRSPAAPSRAYRLLFRFFFLPVFLATAIPASAQIAVPGTPEKPDPGLGGVLAESEGCIDCHGVDGAGIGTLRPNLAGQKEQYLYKQLLHFRIAARGGPIVGIMGRRHPVMGHNVLNLATSDLRHLAAYYAALPCVTPRRETGHARPPTKVRRCWMCHGQSLVSHQPRFPNLAGQKEGYLIRQLRAFRFSDEHPNPGPDMGIWRSHPIMDHQAHQLSDAEIALIADYVSDQSCRLAPPTR